MLAHCSSLPLTVNLWNGWLQGPLGDRMSIPSERARVKANLHLSLRQFADAAKQFESILAAQPDDWGALMGSLDALLPASSSPVEEEASKATEVESGAALQEGLEAAEALVQRLQVRSPSIVPGPCPSVCLLQRSQTLTLRGLLLSFSSGGDSVCRFRC